MSSFRDIREEPDARSYRKMNLRWERTSEGARSGSEAEVTKAGWNGPRPFCPHGRRGKKSRISRNETPSRPSSYLKRSTMKRKRLASGVWPAPKKELGG
ncbi:hypothetical protein GOBAR_AA21598 [Gossypium barbadense]|uniref:Uncharacterized protein n=1 Tax=Gossypium barbadense TaxID=3634 RepID=A0A2P5X6X7_GOSBA|nr:hypothetical protein GOBAR_AA21598 [Gossypium barbadense]